MSKFQNIKQNICLILILSVSVLFGCTNRKNIKVLSFNIGFEKADDSITIWDSKISTLERFFKRNNFDIIGLQDVSEEQFTELQNILLNYSYFGTRITDYNAGKCCPVFYDKNNFTLLTKSQFWLPELSDTIIWKDNMQYIVNWGKLIFNKTGHMFYVFNTRFMDDDSFLQEKSVSFLLKRVYEIAGNAPVIITGDFNFESNKRAYEIMTSKWDRYLSLEDTESFVKKSKNESSANDVIDKPANLDHIFINGHFNVSPNKMYIIKENDFYISNQYPISTKLNFLFDRRHWQGKIVNMPWL